MSIKLNNSSKFPHWTYDLPIIIDEAHSDSHGLSPVKLTLKPIRKQLVIAHVGIYAAWKIGFTVHKVHS